MTSNNETYPRQNIWAGNIWKSMTSKGNCVLSSARLSPREINFHTVGYLTNHQKLVPRETVYFVSLESLPLSSTSGNKINCFHFISNGAPFSMRTRIRIRMIVFFETGLSESSLVSYWDHGLRNFSENNCNNKFRLIRKRKAVKSK